MTENRSRQQRKGIGQAKGRPTLSPRVETARNALIQYIHDHALKRGDRLPAYAEFRNQFGFGSVTIASAVDSLCELGVVEKRDKIGVFVLDPQGGQLTGRTIGVVVRPLAGSAYAATLASFLQKQLNVRNCGCMTFFQNGESADASSAVLSDFPGLEQALREHRCDGLITLVPLGQEALREIADLKLPCCFIGDDDMEEMPLSVLLEARRFLKEATTALRERGCRRLVQLCASQDQLKRRQGELPGLVGCSYEGGAAIARQLLALAPNQRPDGIVSDDDTIVSGLLAELLTQQQGKANYLPEIATIVHVEMGEHYPSRKMLLFHQNIENYAEMAVDLLIRVLRHLESSHKRLYYRFSPPEVS